jgi:hypothetical protein
VQLSRVRDIFAAICNRGRTRRRWRKHPKRDIRNDITLGDESATISMLKFDLRVPVAVTMAK